jgi:hypothetical protein
MLPWIIFDTQKEICELVARRLLAAAINITAGNYFGVRLKCLLQENQSLPLRTYNRRTRSFFYFWLIRERQSDLRLRTFNCAPIAVG